MRLLLLLFCAGLAQFACTGPAPTAAPSPTAAPTAAASPTTPDGTPAAGASPTATPWPTDTPVPTRRWVRLPLGEGIVTAVTVDPAADAMLYAGTNAGGIFKSTDAGRAWTPASPQGVKSAISAIEVLPGPSPAVLAGTRGDGAFRSADGGATWARLDSLSGAHVHALLRDRQPGGPLYAGTNAGAFRSADGGQTWSALPIRASPPDVQAFAQHPKEPLTFYAGTRVGVWRSMDGGSTWAVTGTGLESGNILSLAVDPYDPETVWAGTETAGLYKSSDEGRLWRRAGAGAAGTRVPALVVDARGPAVYSGSGAGVYKSGNALTWDPLGVDLANKNINALSISATGERRLYAATFGGGVFRLSLE